VIEIAPEKNRAYLKIIGFWRNAEAVPNYIADWKKALDGLKKDFTLRKKNELNFEPVKGINFASKFSKYFSDCPYLKENIKNKSLGAGENDLTAIAAIYDRECAPANK
jgi:hypothetical protein